MVKIKDGEDLGDNDDDSLLTRDWVPKDLDLLPFVRPDHLRSMRSMPLGIENAILYHDGKSLLY